MRAITVMTSSTERDQNGMSKLISIRGGARDGDRFSTMGTRLDVSPASTDPKDEEEN